MQPIMHMDRNSDHISANNRTNNSPMLIQQNRKSMVSHQTYKLLLLEHSMHNMT
jgi:hypothetical protein